MFLCVKVDQLQLRMPSAPIAAIKSIFFVQVGMSEKFHLLSKFIAVDFIVIDTKYILSKLVLNRVIKQTESACKGPAAIPQTPIYQGDWDSTAKGQAKHPSPPGALLGDVSCSLSTCTKILHLTALPPASLAPLKGDRLLHKGAWCLLPSSFSPTVAFLCLKLTVLVLNCWRVSSCWSGWCLVEQGTKLCLGRSSSLPYSTTHLSTQCSLVLLFLILDW